MVRAAITLNISGRDPYYPYNNR